MFIIIYFIFYLFIYSFILFYFIFFFFFFGGGVQFCTLSSSASIHCTKCVRCGGPVDLRSVWTWSWWLSILRLVSHHFLSAGSIMRSLRGMFIPLEALDITHETHDQRNQQRHRYNQGAVERWLIETDFIWNKKNETKYQSHIDGLVLERRNSSALAMELRLSCTKSSACGSELRQITNLR